MKTISHLSRGVSVVIFVPYPVVVLIVTWNQEQYLLVHLIHNNIFPNP